MNVKLSVGGQEVEMVRAPDTTPASTKALLEAPPGWTPAPVKNWNSRDGVINSRNSGRSAATSSTKETTPIGEASAGELATKLVGKLLSGDSVPGGIKKLLAKLLKRD